jgi:phage shock protein A
MGILGRLWRVIKGWLLIGVEKAEDPSIILAEAQESMRRELEKAKENAVQAIAARNQLRGVLKDQQDHAAGLEAKARAALKAGEEDLARQLLVEKSTYDQNIEGLKAQLAQAEEAAEKVKANIKRMEAHVRQRAAQRLALEAGWKQAKIQEQLNKALSGISMEGHDQAFSRAEERIRELQARADARIELSEGGLSQKMAKLESVVATGKADQELERMKAEMGILPQTADDPLARLKAEIEQEIGGGGSGGNSGGSAGGGSSSGSTQEEEKEQQTIRNLEV